MSNHIKQLREKAKLTQDELAVLLGIKGGQRRISYYESGSRRPNLDHCRLIVTTLNSAGVPCTLDDVFPPDQEQKKAS